MVLGTVKYIKNKGICATLKTPLSHRIHLLSPDTQIANMLRSSNSIHTRFPFKTSLAILATT